MKQNKLKKMNKVIMNQVQTYYEYFISKMKGGEWC